MKKTFLASFLTGIFAVMTFTLVGCSDRVSRQELGTATGAVIGGVVGSTATHGSIIGTVGGAAAGGVIGHEVTKDK
jgi:osmotically inducible lipoprotein OsmB